MLYLWYDALGEAGALHRREVNEFAAIAKADGVMFHSITYQELIMKLARSSNEDHRDYVRYLTNRYL